MKKKALVNLSKMVTNYLKQKEEFDKEKAKHHRKENNLKHLLKYVKEYAEENLNIILDDNLELLTESESDKELENFDFSILEKTATGEELTKDDDQNDQNESN